MINNSWLITINHIWSIDHGSYDPSQPFKSKHRYQLFLMGALVLCSVGGLIMIVIMECLLIQSQWYVDLIVPTYSQLIANAQSIFSNQLPFVYMRMSSKLHHLTRVEEFIIPSSNLVYFALLLTVHSVLIC